MCLIIKKGQRYQIAKEDIPCYKIIKKLTYRVGYSEDTFHIYCSPFQVKKISHDEVEGKIPYAAYTPFNGGYLMENGERAIGSGAIHTYVKPYNLFTSTANELNHLEEYECIIPKGTKYYVGKDQLENESYASERIIFKEKIS